MLWSISSFSKNLHSLEIRCWETLHSLILSYKPLILLLISFESRNPNLCLTSKVEASFDKFSHSKTEDLNRKSIFMVNIDAFWVLDFVTLWGQNPWSPSSNSNLESRHTLCLRCCSACVFPAIHKRKRKYQFFLCFGLFLCLKVLVFTSLPV